MDKNKKYLEFYSTICIFVVQISKANHNKDHSVVKTCKVGRRLLAFFIFLSFLPFAEGMTPRF